MPYRYPPEFRRKVLDLLAAGRPVASVAADLEVGEQTIYNWRRQEMIDIGKVAGLSTDEAAELASAKHRIRQLEKELAVTLRANELLKAKVVNPRGGSRRSQ